MVVRRRDGRVERGRDSAVRVARTVAVVVVGAGLTALVLSAGDLPVPGGLAAEVIGITAALGVIGLAAFAVGSAESQPVLSPRAAHQGCVARGQTRALIGQTMRTRNALQGGTMNATASLSPTLHVSGHVVLAAAIAVVAIVAVATTLVVRREQ